MRHTRKAVTRYARSKVLREIDLAEAVIEAARAQVSAEGKVTEEHNRLVDALAALDAAEKEQD